MEKQRPQVTSVLSSWTCITLPSSSTQWQGDSSSGQHPSTLQGTTLEKGQSTHLHGLVEPFSKILRRASDALHCGEIESQ